MHIDFDKFMGERITAVHIPSKLCADVFLEEMRRAFPEKTEPWKTAIFEDKRRLGGVCYIPHFESNICMTHWSVDEARRAGYIVLEWEEVTYIDDLQTEVGDKPISWLLS